MSKGSDLTVDTPTKMLMKFANFGESTSPVSIGNISSVSLYDMNLTNTEKEEVRPKPLKNHKKMRAKMARKNMFRNDDKKTELSSVLDSSIGNRKNRYIRSMGSFRNQKLVRPQTNASILTQPSTSGKKRRYGKPRSTFQVVTRDGIKMSGDKFSKTQLERNMKVKSNRKRIGRSKTPNPRRTQVSSRNLVVRTPTLIKNCNLPPSKNEHLRLMMRLDNAISTTNDQPHLYVKRAIAGFHLAHYHKAIRDCHQALSLDYQLSLKLACYYILSMSFHRLGIYGEARTYHKRSLAIVEDPEACKEAFSTKQFFTIENIYNNAGLTYFVMDDWAKALDHFNVAQRLAQQSVHMDPDDQNAQQRIRLYLYNRGTIFYYSHEHTKAIRVLTNALNQVEKLGIWNKLFEGSHQVSETDRSIVIDCLYMRHATYRASFETTRASHDRHCLKQLLGASLSFPTLCHLKYIPQALWVNILSFLSWNDLTHVAYTCKFLKTIAYELSPFHAIHFGMYLQAHQRSSSSNIHQSTATTTLENNSVLNISGICSSDRCSSLCQVDFTGVPLTKESGPFCVSTSVCQLTSLVSLVLDGSTLSPFDHFAILIEIGQSCPHLTHLTLSNFSFPSTSNYLFVHFPKLIRLCLYHCHMGYDFYSDIAFHLRSLKELNLQELLMNDDDQMLFSTRRQALLSANKELIIKDDDNN